MKKDDLIAQVASLEKQRHCLSKVLSAIVNGRKAKVFTHADAPNIHLEVYYPDSAAGGYYMLVDAGNVSCGYVDDYAAYWDSWPAPAFNDDSKAAFAVRQMAWDARTYCARVIQGKINHSDE